MDLKYEHESQWRPHLSWTFSSCSLQQQMEEQAAQRELAWQKLTNRLDGIRIPDGGGYRTFAGSDYKPTRSLFSFEEEEQDYQEEAQQQEQQQPGELLQQSQQEPYQYQHQHHKKQQEKYCNLSIPIASFKQHKQQREQLNKNNNNGYTAITGVDDDEGQDYYEHYKKAKRKCLTVSTILISLTMLLFTIVILMAIGIVHH